MRYRVYDLVMLGADINETLRYGNRMHDELQRILSLPTHAQRVAELSDTDSELARNTFSDDSPETILAEYFLSSDEDFENLPARMMMGNRRAAFMNVEEAQTRHETRAQLLGAAFAIKIAAAELGQFPQVPAAFLVQLGFVDPYTGDGLKVREDARNLVIYSVGRDGEDDLGLTYSDNADRDQIDYDDLRAILFLAP